VDNEPDVHGQRHDEQRADRLRALLGEHLRDEDKNAYGRILHDAVHDFVHRLGRSIDCAEQYLAGFRERLLL